MNLATLENLYRAPPAMKQVVDEFEVAQVNIAQGRRSKNNAPRAVESCLYSIRYLKKGGEQHENRK